MYMYVCELFLDLTQEERILMVDCASENSKDDLKGHDRRMTSSYRIMDELEKKDNWNNDIMTNS